MAQTGTFIGVRVGGAGGSTPPLDSLLGARDLATNLIRVSQVALAMALVFLFLFFVLRVLLRRDWLAAAVFTLIGVALRLGSDFPAIEYPIAAIYYLLVPLLLLRFGLLALIATMMAEILLFESSALTLDASCWYFGYSLVVLLLVAALAAWGFRTALAGRPLLKDETLGG